MFAIIALFSTAAALSEMAGRLGLLSRLRLALFCVAFSAVLCAAYFGIGVFALVCGCVIGLSAFAACGLSAYLL